MATRWLNVDEVLEILFSNDTEQLMKQDTNSDEELCGDIRDCDGVGEDGSDLDYEEEETAKCTCFEKSLMKFLPPRKLNLLLTILHIAAVKYVNLILKMSLVLFLIILLMMLIVAVKFLVILLLLKLHMILILKMLLMMTIYLVAVVFITLFAEEDNLDDNDNDLLVQFRRGPQTRGGKRGSRGEACRSGNRKRKRNVMQNDNDNILIPHEQEPDEN